MQWTLPARASPGTTLCLVLAVLYSVRRGCPLAARTTGPAFVATTQPELLRQTLSLTPLKLEKFDSHRRRQTVAPLARRPGVLRRSENPLLLLLSTCYPLVSIYETTTSLYSLSRSLLFSARLSPPLCLSSSVCLPVSLTLSLSLSLFFSLFLS